MEIILAPNTLEEARRYAGRLSICKVGLPLITEMGSRAALEVADMGYQVLYDGKFLDIPSVVAEAVRWIPYKVWGFTIHVDGDVEMLQAAKEAAAPGLKMFGVLRLTSLPPYPADFESKLAVSKGFVDGVVCPVAEVGYVKQKAPYLLTLCPGVRFSQAPVDDQWQVATFEEVGESQADYLIVGRPLTQAKDPDEALAAIILGE